MNKVLVVGGVVVAGFLGFMVLRKKVGTNKPANSAAGSPRVDNGKVVGQPWYNGVLSAVIGPVENVAKNPLGSLQQSTTSIHSLSDVTGIISGFFGGSSSGNAGPSADASNAQSGAQQGSADDYDTSSAPLPSSNVQQSNLLGVNTDLQDTLPDPASVIISSSDDSGLVDPDNADNYDDSSGLGSDNMAS